MRGGSWNCGPEFCRSAYRGPLSPESVNFDVGFRVVCIP
jgi:formylglycine-generating enzyme required for sulfatase activity